MSKQENFNDILRSKFTERETPVNEEDWRKMRKTIDDSRNRKKRIIWFTCCMLGLLLGIGIYEYVALKNIPQNVVQINSKPLPIAANTDNSSKNSNSTAKEGITPTVNTEKENTSSGTSAKTNSVASDKTMSQNRIASVDLKKKSSVKAESGSENVNYLAGVKTRKALLAEQKTKRANTSNPYKTVSISSETVTGTTTNTPIPAKNINASTDQTISTQADNNLIAASPVSANKKSGSTQNQTLNETSGKPIASTQSAEVKKKSDSVTENTATTEASKNPSTTSTKTDSASSPKIVSEMVPALPPIEGKVPSKNNLSIELGAGYSLGWNYNDTVQGRSINPIIGIGYTHIISNKLALKTGLQLSSLNGMGTSPFIIKHVNYDFGYNSNDTILKTNWLFYLTLPLQIEYKMDEKDAVGLGGTLSYLITGYGQVSSSTFTGDVSKTTSPYSQFMYVKGFNQWNASVFLLYKRTLFGKLSAYIIPYFGLMDIKNNSFFSQNKFERDSGLKLLLSYTIL